MEGAFYGFADPARQVDVCRVDDDPVSIFVDRDDAVERMLALFGFLLMARQTNDLILLLRSEGAAHAQFDDSGRKLIVDAPAGGTKCLVAVLGSRPPLPPTLLIDRPTLWADGVVSQLLLALIRIQDVIFLGMSSDPASGSRPVWAQVCLLHLKFPFRS